MSYQTSSSGGIVSELQAQKNLMVAVATGGPRIDDVNTEYIERRKRIHDELARLGITDANPYPDLWAWYGLMEQWRPPFISVETTILVRTS